MPPSSAPPVLDRPAVPPRGIAPPAPRVPLAGVRERRAAGDAVPTGEVPTSELSTGQVPTGEVPTSEVPTSEVPTGDVLEATRPVRRRLPMPPGRRGPLWLAALVAGAVLAGAPGLLGSGAPAPAVDASDYGLGVAADLAAAGDMADTDVRRGITEAEAQARLGELAASRAAREPKTVVPVTQFRLTTCFCMRWGQMHYGLDMAAPLGTPIYAAADGVVLRAGRASGFGNAVYIQDVDGNVHIYGHMRYYDVQAGDLVQAGDQIATVGNEGYSTGPHLHYEIHRGGEGGRPIDPEEWLAERGVVI